MASYKAQTALYYGDNLAVLRESIATESCLGLPFAFKATSVSHSTVRLAICRIRYISATFFIVAMLRIAAPLRRDTSAMAVTAIVVTLIFAAIVSRYIEEPIDKFRQRLFEWQHKDIST